MEFHTADRLYATSNGPAVFRRHVQYISVRDNALVGANHEWMLMCAEIIQASYQWPHYQVWPEYVFPLASVPMTDVTLQDFRMPFPSLTVQLPKTGDGLLFGEREVEAITALDYTAADLERALRFFDKRWVTAHANKRDDRNMAIVVQCRATEEEKANMTGGLFKDCKVARFIDWFSPHIMPPDRKIEDVLAGLAKDQKIDTRNLVISHVDPGDFEKCWRLVCSVAFLATGKHRLIQPAVLNKDLAAYLEALGKDDDCKIRQLHNKASERRNSKGWTVGRLHQILVGKPASQADGESPPTGRELRNQHIRSGHYHTYRVGAGRQATIKKFVLPTIVRPDLPLPAQSPDRVLRKLQDDGPGEN
jgi:hemerythrin